MTTATKWIALFSGALLILSILAAMIIDIVFTTEVLIIAPKDPEMVRMEKVLWVKGDPVADIYGIPSNQKTRIVLVDKARLIHPVEDPTLVLLPVDKNMGENPLQIKTVWFVTRYVSFALASISILAFTGFILLRRRKIKSSPPQII